MAEKLDLRSAVSFVECHVNMCNGFGYAGKPAHWSGFKKAVLSTCFPQQMSLQVLHASQTECTFERADVADQTVFVL